MSLLFSFPGAPLLVYGDEIGMGDDSSLHGRNAVRTSMQWSNERHAGFSTIADGRLRMPVIADGPFGYERVNATDQAADPGSLLSWTKRLIAVRRQAPEFGSGWMEVVRTGAPSVFAHRCRWEDRGILGVHNLGPRGRSVTLDLGADAGHSSCRCSPTARSTRPRPMHRSIWSRTGIGGIASRRERVGDVSSSRWWQRGIIYQIYPRSFADGNGDGIGDLQGILDKLDYLEWLGVDALWLSPIYPSPMIDFGYDVSDYTGVDPIFGALEDLDVLLASAHRRGLKVILDFVPNHTSDQHPWFVESRSSRHHEKREWYIWRDPAPDGGPPNNWLSTFGGSAWEWDAKTEQYYYHAYLKQQPDLNWRHPAVRDAMHGVMRFWLDRGVDGFRVDVIWHLIKDEEFRCNPPNPDYRPGQWPYHQLLATYTTDRPEVYQIIAGMRDVIDGYEDRLMVGEIYLPVDRLVTYYGTGGSGVHLPFNFQLLELPWDAGAIAATIDAYEAALPVNGWPNWVLGNHDKSRIASRVGFAQARVAAMLLLTLRGTPTMYYGDEIGMVDVPIPPEQIRDPWEKNVPGYGVGRDPARTPMQWDTREHAGFTTGIPWLPVPETAAAVNVAVQRDDSGSPLSLYRRLIGLRRAEKALLSGTYRRVDTPNPDVIVYRRETHDSRLLVALNLVDRPQRIVLESVGLSGSILLSTHLDRDGEPLGKALDLRIAEGVIARLTTAG